MQYALGPFVVAADKESRGQHPSASHMVMQTFTPAALGLPIDQTEKMEGGFTLQAFPDDVSVPSEFDLVAQSPSLSDSTHGTLNKRSRSFWEKHAGFSPSGVTLADAILETWGSKADPSHEAGGPVFEAAPIPGRNGLHLWIAHSSEPGGYILEPQKVYPFAEKIPFWSWNNYEARLKLGLERVAAESSPVVLEKAFGMIGVEVLGLSPHEVATSKELELLRPRKLSGLKARKPETYLSRTFTEADNNTISGWTEYVGNSTGDGFEIVSNFLQNKNGSAAVTSMRHDTDLSSGNHTCRALITYRSSSSAGGGVMARFGTTNAGYRAAGNPTGSLISLQLVSAGAVFSTFSAVTAAVAASEFPVAVIALGSNITCDFNYLTPASRTTLTYPDGSYGTSIFKCGVSASASTTAGNNHKWRNWVAFDSLYQTFPGYDPSEVERIGVGY